MKGVYCLIGLLVFALNEERDYQVKRILDFQLKDLMENEKRISFVVFFKESDLLSENLLRNVSNVMRRINGEISFYSVDIDKNKKQYKRLGLKSFPCGILIHPPKFYKFSSPFQVPNLLTFLSSNSFESLPSYSLPRSLNLLEYSLEVLNSGFKGHWVFTFNLLIFLGLFLLSLFYCFRQILSTSSKSLKTN
jgi:hypothetical protein